MLREGLGRFFADAGHEVVASLGDGERLLDTVDETDPDLVVVDVRMPPTFTDEGARAARQSKDARPQTGVLVLSQHIEVTHAVALVSLGGFGYLLKDRVLAVDELTLRGGASGPRRIGLDPKVVASLVRLTNAAIAKRLFMSERTVEAHVRHILMKLDIPQDDESHRRVLAVLAHLSATERGLSAHP